MSNALSLPSGDHGTARIPSIRSASHLSESGILLTFAARLLIAFHCPVTTAASDDELRMPTRMESRFPFSSACRLGQSSLRISGSVCCPFGYAACVAVSFRRCRCRTCSSCTQHIPPASQISLRWKGLWSQCDAPAQPSVFWPDQPRVHVR